MKMRFNRLERVSVSAFWCCRKLGACLTLAFITQLHKANDVFIVSDPKCSLFSLIFLLCRAEEAQAAFELFASPCFFT